MEKTQFAVGLVSIGLIVIENKKETSPCYMGQIRIATSFAMSFATSLASSSATSHVPCHCTRGVVMFNLL
jgi:hypothetical protein